MTAYLPGSTQLPVAEQVQVSPVTLHRSNLGCEEINTFLNYSRRKESHLKESIAKRNQESTNLKQKGLMLYYDLRI
jgi:hypothetical protein